MDSTGAIAHARATVPRALVVVLDRA